MKPSTTNDYIPHLLDLFLIALISRKLLDSESSSTERTIRLKESFVQDLVFSFTNEVVETPKSVLFPSVVKALCNNTEILNLINKYGYGVSYDLVEEHALIRSYQRAARKPTSVMQKESRSTVAPCNIDNLECTLSVSGRFQRENSILVTERNERAGEGRRVR